MEETKMSIHSPALIRKGVKKAAILSISKMQQHTALSTFAMKPYSKIEQWFTPKSWVSDSCISKVFAEFRSSNIGIGNRKPAGDGNFYKLCPLCKKQGIVAPNNEVHLVVECPSMEIYRNNCSIGPFLKGFKSLNPQISPLKLYSLILCDERPDEIRAKAIGLYSMKLGWHSLMKIPLPIF